MRVSRSPAVWRYRPPARNNSRKNYCRVSLRTGYERRARSVPEWGHRKARLVRGMEKPNPPPVLTGRSVDAVDAEIDDLAQGEFPWRAGNSSKASRAMARNGGRAQSYPRARVQVQGGDRGLEVALGDRALLRVRRQNSRCFCERAGNDRTTGRVIFPSRKSSPTFLAELSRGSTVVERVVDELECDAEIQAVAAACCNLRLGPLPEQGRLRRGAEQAAVLARITAR